LPFIPRRSDAPSEPGTAPDPTPSTASDIPAELLQFLFYLLVGIVIASALYLLFQWWLARRDQASAMRTDLSEPAPSTTQDALQAAHTNASQRDYRLALRHLHTAALIHLDRLGFLTYEATSTDWEHLRALRAQGHEALHTELLPITELVQRKWYGLEAASAEDFQIAQRILQPILAREEIL
jgi:hypothetical protein